MNLTSKARCLRKNQTHAEAILWRRLRGRQLQGYKFRRQYVVAGYIVDFVCLEEGVIVELDGGQHLEQQAYDAQRTERLQEHGYRVLRFWNDEVLNNMEGVLIVITQALGKL